MARSRKDSEADVEARRRIAQAQIRQFPDPVLRSATAPVEAFDEHLAELAERMIGIADDAVGTGLAAPQIGLVRRFIVVSLADDEPWIPMANVAITRFSDEREVGGEGCLSLDVLLREKHSVPVERAVAVDVRWQDLAGDWREATYEGFAARVLQHEVDHLDGILTVDRAEPAARREALRVLREHLS